MGRRSGSPSSNRPHSDSIRYQAVCSPRLRLLRSSSFSRLRCWPFWSSSCSESAVHSFSVSLFTFSPFDFSFPSPVLLIRLPSLAGSSLCNALYSDNLLYILRSAVNVCHLFIHGPRSSLHRPYRTGNETFVDTACFGVGLLGWVAVCRKRTRQVSYILSAPSTSTGCGGVCWYNGGRERRLSKFCQGKITRKTLRVMSCYTFRSGMPFTLYTDVCLSHRKRYLLVADGSFYFILALFDVLAHNISLFRSDFNAFRSFDIAIGASARSLSAQMVVANSASQFLKVLCRFYLSSSTPPSSICINAPTTFPIYPHGFLPSPMDSPC